MNRRQSNLNRWLAPCRAASLVVRLILPFVACGAALDDLLAYFRQMAAQREH